MKRLPDSELELMMIIWNHDHAVSRKDIEKHIGAEKKWTATTILSFLTRLVEKGFVEVEKRGKINYYRALIKEQDYMNKESKSILEKMYNNSIKNFITALYDGNNLSDKDITELQTFINEKRNN